MKVLRRLGAVAILVAIALSGLASNADAHTSHGYNHYKPKHEHKVKCYPTTTTMVRNTTTTVVPPTTTTTMVEVPTTTVPQETTTSVPENSTTTTPPVSPTTRPDSPTTTVAAPTTVAPLAPHKPKPAPTVPSVTPTLPATGFDSLWLVPVAMVLILAGLALVLGPEVRRRRDVRRNILRLRVYGKPTRSHFEGNAPSRYVVEPPFYGDDKAL